MTAYAKKYAVYFLYLLIEKQRVPLLHTMISALTLSTTNGDLRLPAIHMKDRISLTVNGGNIKFEGPDAGQEISLNAKNGDISGTILGRYEEYAIECNIKKGESNLPKQKEEGNKSLHVKNNNGDIAIEFKEE